MESINFYYKKQNKNFFDLNNVFQYFPDGIVCKDKYLKYICVNKSYCKMFSIMPETVIFKDCNPYFTKEVVKLIHNADLEVKNNTFPINYVIDSKDNRILQITSSPIIINNEFQGLISLVRDITQEETIKENFVNKHFEQLNAEKILQSQRETFVASIGHDLKNPTIAQIRSLELLLKGTFGELTLAQKELLEMILDSCRYMNGMLSSLLETYRNYGGAVKLNFENFSLNELVNECISEMIYVAKDKNLNIIKDFCNEINVYGDRIQIKRVIMNLLSNGIKYAFKNTDLKLRTYYYKKEIGFEFENLSPYISEEKQKTLFARYVSYAGAYKELGIGLGLYASNKIITSHNGKLYVKSFKKNKNIFGFKIPQHNNKLIEKNIYF